jgi:hypothetical protein
VTETTDAQDALSNRDVWGDSPEARDPRVRFAFDFPDLRAAFKTADKTANKARKASRAIGFWAIGLVLAALLLASADPLIASTLEARCGCPDAGHAAEPAHAPAGAVRAEPAHAEPAHAPASCTPDSHCAEETKHILELLGYLAAGLGVAGTIVAIVGMMKSSPRRVWLRARLQTETMRLFHFHYLASRLPEVIAASDDPAKQKAYVDERRHAFETVQARIKDPEAALTTLLDESEHAPLEGLAAPLPPSALAASPALDLVFSAWKELRLDWQLGFCDYKLRDAAPKGRPTPKRQEKLFTIVGWACIIVIVVLHFTHFAESVLHINRLLLQAATVWTALIALATRALEGGLAPQREVERYEGYRVNIKVAKARFEAAATPATKLETMRAFETVTVEEMIVFMRTHAKSHFLL